MTNDNCAGKTQVEKDISNILDITKNNREYTEDIAQKLANDLCCVTYLVDEIYFNWKKLWFKKRKVEKSLSVVYQGEKYNKSNITVISELPYSWPCDHSEKFTISVFTSRNKEGNIVSRLSKWNYPDWISMTYEEFLGTITKRIALYKISQGN